MVCWYPVILDGLYSGDCGIVMNKELIDKAIAENSPVLFRNIFPITPYWNDFILHLNHAMSQPDEGVRETVNDTIGYAHFWARLTATVDHAESWFPQVPIVMSKIKESHPVGAYGAFSILSFTSLEKTTGNHTDPVDIFYWQCIGTAEWIFSESGDFFVLRPGDIIFVPGGKLHEIKSKTPRAAISFTCNKK